LTEQPEITEAEMWAKKDVNLSTAVGDLEEVRSTLLAIKQKVEQGGAPEELQAGAKKLAQDAESFEVQLHNYVCGVAA
jgi:hypothetical protein